MICRLPPYLNLTSDNTKHLFVDLLNFVSDSCQEVLHKIGLANPIDDITGERNKFKSSSEFSYSVCYILSMKPGELPNSPYKSQTFCFFRYMKNCQLLNKSCSCYKYCCKYITKIDKQKYFIFKTDKDRTRKLL